MNEFLLYVAQVLLRPRTRQRKGSFDPAKDYTGYANGQGFFGSSVDYQSKITKQQSVMLQTTPKVYVPRGSIISFKNVEKTPIKPLSPSTPTNTIRKFR